MLEQNFKWFFSDIVLHPAIQWELEIKNPLFFCSDKIFLLTNGNVVVHKRVKTSNLDVKGSNIRFPG
jgi:hypothetical protein